MSTKTTFKRVALVAVAALGLGVLSVAPSQATIINLVTAQVNGTATTAVSDSTTAATMRITFTGTAATDSVTITSYISSQPATTTLGSSNILVRLVDTATSTVATTVTEGGSNAMDLVANSLVEGDSTTAVLGTSSTGTVSANLGYFLRNASQLAAGTYVITNILTPFSNGIAGTQITREVSIVVSATAAQSRVANAGNSSATVSAGTTGGVATENIDDSVAALATASSTEKATIRVILRNAANQPAAAESVTATVTGPGLIGTSSTGFGKSMVFLYTAGASGLDIDVRSDGTAGTASIAISTPSVKFGNKTITFYAAAAKEIAATANKPVIAVATTDAVVYAQAKDANGIAWGGAAYIYASTAADALIAGSATPVACTYVPADDVHACPVSGTTAGTAKLKVIDAATVALATATSNEVSVRVSTGVPTTAKLAFDKATYAPGEKAQIWVNALDAAGLALAERSISNLFAAGGITSSTAFSAGSDTLTATTIDLAGATSASAGTVAGYKVYTVYMPMSSGAVTISATGGTGLAASGRVAISASAEVVNSSVDAATDAANEATDAANAATDAALAAADAADAATAAAQDASDAVAALSASVSKLISSLRAQITSLTNLVIKIQKKVRA
jgi:trimeric autotransporter adhesin